MTKAAAACCLLLSSPLTIFSMESSSLIGLLEAATADGGDDAGGGDRRGEDDGRGGDGPSLPEFAGGPFAAATLSNAELPEVPMDAAAAVGDDNGENFCRNLSAAARDDAVEPAAYAEARSGFCAAFPALSVLSIPQDQGIPRHKD